MRIRMVADTASIVANSVNAVSIIRQLRAKTIIAKTIIGAVTRIREINIFE